VNENSRPGEIVPEFHPGASDVVVWESRSLFIHVTLVPVWTVRSGGANALFPRNSAPTGMTMDDDAPPGVGAGDGVGEVGEVGVDGELSLHAVADRRSVSAVARRSGNIGFLQS
jgi:hypothetical protein